MLGPPSYYQSQASQPPGLPDPSRFRYPASKLVSLDLPSGPPLSASLYPSPVSLLPTYRRMSVDMSPNVSQNHTGTVAASDSIGSSIGSTSNSDPPPASFLTNPPSSHTTTSIDESSTARHDDALTPGHHEPAVVENLLVTLKTQLRKMNNQTAAPTHLRNGTTNPHHQPSSSSTTPNRTQLATIRDMTGTPPARSEDEEDSYIDITGNSTPQPARSDRDDEDLLDGDGESDDGSVGGGSVVAAAEQTEQPSAVPDVVLQEVGQTKATRGGRGSRGKRGGRGRGGGAKAAVNAARRKSVVVPTSGSEAASTTRKPKQQKRSRRDSIIAAELGEATLKARTESPYHSLALAKFDSLAQGRKRKRVDYAALSKGVGHHPVRDRDDTRGSPSSDGPSPSSSTTPSERGGNGSGKEKNGSPHHPEASAADDPDRLYCLCRQPMGAAVEGDFYIGCEGCDEWFHASCVGVTAEEAKGIEKWMCKECGERGLKTEWKRRCMAEACENWVEAPESSEETNVDEGGGHDTPASHLPTTAPDGHPHLPPPPTTPTRYCSTACALRTATTLSKTLIPLLPLRPPLHPPSHEQTASLLADRLTVHLQIRSALASDVRELERLDRRARRERRTVRRLERRRRRIRGAIVRCVEMHDGTTVAPVGEVDAGEAGGGTTTGCVPVGDRICGFDGRIVGEWVVDVDDDDDDDDDDDHQRSSHLPRRSRQGDDDGEKEDDDEDEDDPSSLPPPANPDVICTTRGARCPLHDMWDTLKWAEVQLELDQAMERLEDLRRDRRRVRESLRSRWKILGHDGHDGGGDRVVDGGGADGVDDRMVGVVH
ncbi:JmjC domain-containing histone demethylation protein 1 [Thoreauomyces humboldtii]|nr:JmjC domain-containing histone demethylation protein 1 [Thoreauomyces humboldtii]